YQYPENTISNHMLNSCQHYVIPKLPFSNKLISFIHEQHLFMGVFQRIENYKYDRNALMFNLLLVFDHIKSDQNHSLSNTTTTTTTTTTNSNSNSHSSNSSNSS